MKKIKKLPIILLLSVVFIFIIIIAFFAHKLNTNSSTDQKTITRTNYNSNSSTDQKTITRTNYNSKNQKVRSFYSKIKESNKNGYYESNNYDFSFSFSNEWSLIAGGKDSKDSLSLTLKKTDTNTSIWIHANVSDGHGCQRIKSENYKTFFVGDESISVWDDCIAGNYSIYTKNSSNEDITIDIYYPYIDDDLVNLADINSVLASIDGLTIYHTYHQEINERRGR